MPNENTKSEKKATIPSLQDVYESLLEQLPKNLALKEIPDYVPDLVNYWLEKIYVEDKKEIDRALSKNINLDVHMGVGEHVYQKAYAQSAATIILVAKHQKSLEMAKLLVGHYRSTKELEDVFSYNKNSKDLPLYDKYVNGTHYRIFSPDTEFTFSQNQRQYETLGLGSYLTMKDEDNILRILFKHRVLQTNLPPQDIAKTLEKIREKKCLFTLMRQSGISNDYELEKDKNANAEANCQKLWESIDRYLKDLHEEKQKKKQEREKQQETNLNENADENEVDKITKTPIQTRSFLDEEMPDLADKEDQTYFRVPQFNSNFTTSNKAEKNEDEINDPNQPLLPKEDKRENYSATVNNNNLSQHISVVNQYLTTQINRMTTKWGAESWKLTKLKDYQKELTNITDVTQLKELNRQILDTVEGHQENRLCGIAKLVTLSFSWARRTESKKEFDALVTNNELPVASPKR